VPAGLLGGLGFVLTAEDKLLRAFSGFTVATASPNFETML
jgi:hypothetical protein